MFNIRLPQTRMILHSGVCAIVLLLVLALSYVCHNSKPLSAAEDTVDGRVQGGSLVIAGGGYVTPEIRQRFFELAGGAKARIVVIPAVDPQPGTEESWLAPWRKIGATHVQLCNAHDKPTANTASFCAAFRDATGVWFSGGYQDLLASRYVDTKVQKCLVDVLRRNGVVGGCSAGAAILSRVMIQEGESQPIEARGLGLIPNAVIDQHFLQRNRLWRLQLMLQAHPELLGLGIDEDTALIFELQTERLSVVGDSYAMVCVPPVGTHAGRTEILHSGDNVLLNQLRKEHMAYQPIGTPKSSQSPPLESHSA